MMVDAGVCKFEDLSSDDDNQPFQDKVLSFGMLECVYCLSF